MAAAAIAAAASQKDLGWYKTGKVAKKPKLTDPVQLYSLCEVLSSEGTGPEAMLTVKVEVLYSPHSLSDPGTSPGRLSASQTARTAAQWLQHKARQLATEQSRHRA